MNIMPFEVRISEHSFRVMSQNEITHLNSLSGRLERLTPAEIDHMRAAVRSDEGNNIPRDFIIL